MVHLQIIAKFSGFADNKLIVAMDSDIQGKTFLCDEQKPFLIAPSQKLSHENNVLLWLG